MLKVAHCTCNPLPGGSSACTSTPGPSAGQARGLESSCPWKQHWTDGEGGFDAQIPKLSGLSVGATLRNLLQSPSSTAEFSLIAHDGNLFDNPPFASFLPFPALLSNWCFLGSLPKQTSCPEILLSGSTCEGTQTKAQTLADQGTGERSSRWLSDWRIIFGKI